MLDDSMREDFLTFEIIYTTWKVPKRYENLKLIGLGAFGSVCSAYDNKLKCEVAIKKMNRPFQSAEHGKRTYRELKILSHVAHDNVIYLMDAFSPQLTLQTFDDIYLVTPLIDSDLNQIVKTQRIPDENIQFLVYQMLRALKYLHSCNLVHRDLKPSNIAVTQDNELKILDFGLARQSDAEMTGYVATRWYRAPEIIMTWEHYTKAVDVWSVGCIMAEMMTGQPLFPGNSHLEQLQKIIAVTGSPTPDMMDRMSENAREFIRDNIPHFPRIDFYGHFSGANPTAIDLLDRILVMDPAHRVTVEEALAHPYFEFYHDEEDEPEGEVYIDEHENQNDITVPQWKGYVWECLVNFTPRSQLQQ